MNLYSALKSVEKFVKFRCLSCEGEIITFLLENGPSKPSKIIAYSRYSNVHVYNKLKDLTEIGVIEKSKINGPRCFYKINEGMKENIFNSIEIRTAKPLQFIHR